jgi:hypothetical protein
MAHRTRWADATRHPGTRRVSAPRRRHRLRWLALALVPALLATSCPAFIRVDVAPGPGGATAPELRFSYQRTALQKVDSLTVYACPPQAVYGAEYDSALLKLPVRWRITRDEGAAPAQEPLRVTYGRIPPGYREEAPAAPLAVGGCYHVRAVTRLDSALAKPLKWFDVDGAQTFRLLPDGRMIVGNPEGTFFDRRALRETNQAAVACARGYRRARTQADSAAVDGREHAVLNHPLSCGWLRTHWPDVLTSTQTTERTLLAAVASVIGLVGIIASGVKSDE